ncbi:MAG: COX15/CtaA family protein [Burkholderiaceae bacterium]
MSTTTAVAIGHAASGEHRRRALRRMAQACLGLVILIIVLSAFMRHHGAGIGCADWPACYGQDTSVAPDASAGDGVALARLAHRATASLALVLILAMVLACLAARPVLRSEGVLAVLLLLFAVGLAALGVVSAGARMPAVILGNLLGGFAMLALCARLVAVAGRPPGWRPDAMIGRVAAVVLLLLIAQLALGALVSASHSALACASLGECFELAGRGGWQFAAFDPLRIPVPGGADGMASGGMTPGGMVSDGIDNVDGATLQFVHRIGAILATGAVLALGVLAWRRGRRKSALAMAGLLAGVLALGMHIGGGALSMPAVLMHNLGAAGLLAVVLRLP